jgi:hypothetical protein
MHPYIDTVQNISAVVRLLFCDRSAVESRVLCIRLLKIFCCCPWRRPSEPSAARCRMCRDDNDTAAHACRQPQHVRADLARSEAQLGTMVDALVIQVSSKPEPACPVGFRWRAAAGPTGQAALCGAVHQA